MRIIVFILFALFLSHCNVKEKMHKLNRGKEMADSTMNNLGKPEIVVDRFPEKFFPRDQLMPVLHTLARDCDFESKRGKFVDFYTMLKNGKSSTAYIYEYFLNCDSIRFIYVYNFDTAEPELMQFTIEGLEVENPMIIYPEKRLLNSPP